MHVLTNDPTYLIMTNKLNKLKLRKYFTRGVGSRRSSQNLMISPHFVASSQVVSNEIYRTYLFSSTSFVIINELSIEIYLEGKQLKNLVVL